LLRSSTMPRFSSGLGGSNCVSHRFQIPQCLRELAKLLITSPRAALDLAAQLPK
jgi:hypothetical protein